MMAFAGAAFPSQRPSCSSREGLFPLYQFPFNADKINTTLINNTYPNNTDLNKTRKTYTALPSGVHIFLDIYKDQFKRYKEREHMGVTEEQLVSIENAINRHVEFGVTEEEFLEAVTDHFENLPADNNGNIIAFLYTCMRRFEVDVIYYCN
jgi:hypothetical protein